MPGDARPTIKVEINLANAALDGTSLTWTDVSAYVVDGIRYSWGRDTAVDQFQPGKGSFRLLNNDGRFDPSNTSGPYYGNLKPRRKVRISAIGDGLPGHLPSGAGYVIASGWIRGWPQTPVGRRQVYVDVEFYDFLDIAGTLPMPESIYDWQIAETAPFAWYKMNDATWMASDSSGNDRHGQWRVYEGYQQPWQGELMPANIVKGAETDPLVVSTGRPGRSWASMQADVGQPLGGISGAPRTPALVTHRDTGGLLAGDFTVEFWIVPRQAFNLDITGQYSSTTPILQPIVTWGADTDGGRQYSIQIEPTTFTASIWKGGIGHEYAAMTDNDTHHLVFVYDLAPTPTLSFYLDGVLDEDYALSGLGLGSGFSTTVVEPAVIGYALPAPYTSGLQSILSDVIFWNRKLTATEVLKNYRAGKYGNLTTSGSAPLTIANAFVDAFSLAGAEEMPYANANTSTDLEILPTGTQGKTLADYLRLLSSSEQGPLYWDPGGSTWGQVQFRGRNWSVGDSQSTTSQATLSDASGAAKGYSEVTYRDGSDLIANDITVRYAGGEKKATNPTSIADYGPVSGSVETILIDPERANQVGQYLAWKGGQPPATTIIPERVVFQPTTSDEFSTAGRSRPGTRLTLVRTRPDGTTLTADYWVDSIDHDIEAASGGAWTTTYGVSPADDPARPFVFGTSTFGGTDVLWI